MRIAVILAVVLLAGCSLTPTQKKWAGFAAGVLIVGAIAAHEADNGKPPEQSLAIGPPPGAPCTPQPNGTCR